MNTQFEELKEEMNKVKIWTVKAYVDYDHHVYAYTSLNKAIKKAYEIVREIIKAYDSLECEGSFEKEIEFDSQFKYSLKTCKELVKYSMIQTYAYDFSFQDSAYGRHDTIYDIEIQGHDGKE